MHEIELKFQVETSRRAAVERAVAARRSAAPMRLQAAYFDTAERVLARAGLALRLRREGPQWVQTLKGAPSDGLTRLEHNVPRPGRSATLPALDVTLHAGTAVGERLRRALHAVPEGALICLFRTDIRRLQRTLRTRLGTVELAFDTGHIVAGTARLPVCELEIELLRGDPMAVIETARRWRARHGLWLDTRSKAERGDLLSRGQGMADERKAAAVALTPHMGWAQARRTVLASCLDQVSVNASQIASGRFADEHVHQLRVGLRRLRTALPLFADACADPGSGQEAPSDAALAEPAAQWFTQLGAARDQAAVAGPLQAQMQADLQSVGATWPAPRLPAAADAVDPAALARSPIAQQLMLDLLAAVQRPVAASVETSAPAPSGQAEPRPLRAALAQRLTRWHRKLVADAARFSELDEVQRHGLRKRAKRLRYAAEFAAALFDARAARRFLKPLRALQAVLGELNDLSVAIEGFRASQDTAGPSSFALGWLLARRGALLAQAPPTLRAFAKAKRFWRG